MSAKDIQFFFLLRNQVKLYHWQTKSYSRHKATDDAVEKLDSLIDQYVEVYMGKYGRPRMTASTGTLVVKNVSEQAMVRFIQQAIAYLQKDLVKHLKASDTDLINLRDEIMADLHQLLYLFTLK